MEETLKDVLVKDRIHIIWLYYDTTGFRECDSCQELVYCYLIKWCGSFHSNNSIPCSDCSRVYLANRKITELDYPKCTNAPETYWKPPFQGAECVTQCLHCTYLAYRDLYFTHIVSPSIELRRTLVQLDLPMDCMRQEQAKMAEQEKERDTFYIKHQTFCRGPLGNYIIPVTTA